MTASLHVSFPRRRRESAGSRLLCLLSSACLALVACGGGGGASQASLPEGSSGSVTVPRNMGIASDGVDGALLEVRLADGLGTPLAGRRIDVQATGQANTFWPAASIATDAAGRAAFRLTSTVAEAKLVTLTAMGAGTSLVIADGVEVRFEQPAVPRRRVSVSSAGDEANDFSRDAAVSANGRWVAFLSKADNLVAGDSNEKEDVFVFDRDDASVERVSLTPTGGQFPDLCGEPSLSDDGMFVAFTGRLRDDDDVWVRDRIAGFTEPISVAAGLSGRSFAPAISGDGRFVAFVNDDGEQQQVYVFDRALAVLELVSRGDSGAGNQPSQAPSISRDGRFVAFASEADNLVPGDSNEKIDVFVRDRVAATTTLVSRGAAGAPGDDDSVEAAIAADGRFVAFASKAENLVAGDDNGKSDVFVVDMVGQTIERASVGPQAQELDKESWAPALSADGRFVVFASLSDEVVVEDSNGKEDIFRRDLFSATTVRVSLGVGAVDPNEASTAPALAADSAVVAFTSKASNLVPSDENDTTDVFVAPRE